MTSARVVRASAAVALAAALAGSAVVANLRLIESHGRRVEPLSLSTAGSTAPTSSATGPGGGPSTTDTTTTTAPPSTVLASTTVPGDAPTTTAAPATITSHAVGDAGTVVLSVQGGTVTVVSVQVTSGWTYLVEKPSGVEVEVELHRGADGAEASFHARLEGGALRVDVGDEDIEGPDD